MKNTYKMLLAVAALGSIASNALAHIYSFSNHTENNIKIRMQLGGIGEPWYYLGPDPYKTNPDFAEQEAEAEIYDNTLPSRETYEFRFEILGKKKFEKMIKAGYDKALLLDYERKFGFCLARLQYKVQDAVGNWKAWRAITPKFIESELYNALLSASSELAEGIVSTAAATAKEAGGPKGKVAGGVAEKVPVSSIVKSAGELIGYSLCRERHLDIILTGDEVNPIAFVTIKE